jgi:hypothetical protein
MGTVRACDDCNESTENTFRRAVTDVTENVSHVGSTCKGQEDVIQLLLIASAVFLIYLTTISISQAT